MLCTIPEYQGILGSFRSKLAYLYGAFIFIKNSLLLQNECNFCLLAIPGLWDKLRFNIYIVTVNVKDNTRYQGGRFTVNYSTLARM